VQIAAGGEHSLAMRDNGAVAAWGDDFDGQLGNNAALVDQPMPVSITGLTASAVSGGGNFSLAVGFVTCLDAVATKIGTAGADTLTGTAGVDVLVGQGSADEISGLGSGDTLCGGNGADTLEGGSGTDSCDGGAGQDNSTSCELKESIP
jgi:Ca2+-binding RTX toxin-like protein